MYHQSWPCNFIWEANKRVKSTCTRDLLKASSVNMWAALTDVSQHTAVEWCSFHNANQGFICANFTQLNMQEEAGILCERGSVISQIRWAETQTFCLEANVAFHGITQCEALACCFLPGGKVWLHTHCRVSWWILGLCMEMSHHPQFSQRMVLCWILNWLQGARCWQIKFDTIRWVSTWGFGGGVLDSGAEYFIFVIYHKVKARNMDVKVCTQSSKHLRVLIIFKTTGKMPSWPLQMLEKTSESGIM